MTRPLCPRCRNPGYLRAAFATGIIGHDIRAVPERPPLPGRRNYGRVLPRTRAARGVLLGRAARRPAGLFGCRRPRGAHGRTALRSRPRRSTSARSRTRKPDVALASFVGVLPRHFDDALRAAVESGIGRSFSDTRVELDGASSTGASRMPSTAESPRGIGRANQTSRRMRRGWEGRRFADAAWSASSVVIGRLRRHK